MNKVPKLRLNIAIDELIPGGEKKNPTTIKIVMLMASK
jgi:hypothetical protein